MLERVQCVVALSTQGLVTDIICNDIDVTMKVFHVIIAVKCLKGVCTNRKLLFYPKVLC